MRDAMHNNNTIDSPVDTQGITALIPLKARSECKSRLAGKLDADQRKALVHKMLGDIIDILSVIPRINRIVIVSPESEGLPEDVDYIRDSGEGLNNSLLYAAEKLYREGCQQLLILPADLAYLESTDVEQLIAASDNHDLVIAPSCDNGTNALLFSAKKPITFCFGPNSFSAHRQFASKQGYSCSVVESYGLRTDIDTTRDLDACDLDIGKLNISDLNPGNQDNRHAAPLPKNDIEADLPNRARA